jgi:DNA-binding GntR family transcriptional regulator
MLNITSLREQVYQYLRDEMHSRQLLPGSTINLNSISEKLGISKTPLRDALIRLESEGFVTILPRRGVQVNLLTLQDIKNAYEIVGALEGAVIVNAFDQLTTSHVTELTRLNEAMRKSVLANQFDDYYKLNLDFHQVYLDLSDNKELQRLITPYKLHLYDFPRRCYLQEWELRNCDEHDQFIDKVRQGDCKGAARVMKDVHWSFAVQEDYILRFYSLMEKQLNEEKQLNGQDE